MVLQPCSVQIGDLQHEAVLVQFEAAAQVFDAGSIHAAQMQKQHPVHSFLFDMKGTCLHANQAAIHHWYSQGKPMLGNNDAGSVQMHEAFGISGK